MTPSKTFRVGGGIKVPKKRAVRKATCLHCGSTSVTYRGFTKKGSKEITIGTLPIKGTIQSDNLVTVYDCKKCGRPFSLPVK
jgi:transcription elongation factor Elf1